MPPYILQESKVAQSANGIMSRHINAKKRRDSAREAILDAAEALFAKSGYDGVPVRKIANAANVGVSLVTYHFASKEQLFEEVIARRTELLNSARTRALEIFFIERKGDLRYIVESYTHPYLELMSGGEVTWKNYGELIAQIANSPTHADIIHRHFDKAAILFADALMIIYPKATRENAFRAVVYGVSVMLSVFSSHSRVEILSNSEVSSDYLEAYPTMVEFICAGIHALLSTK